MSIFSNIFVKPKITAGELKSEVRAKERDRRRKIIELRRLEQKKEKLLAKAKKARKTGDNFQVDVIWEDMKNMRVDEAFLKREMKILNLEYITLKRYLHGMERLEKKADNDSIGKLIVRVRESGLESRLASQDIDETAYIEELNSIMEGIGLQTEEYEESYENDPEKEKFLQALDDIVEAEESGNMESAALREDELKSSFSEEQAPSTDE